MAIKQTLIDFSKALKSAIQVQKNVTDIAADYIDKLSDENFDGVTPEEMEEVTGDLDDLTTTTKTNLVAAINEVNAINNFEATDINYNGAITSGTAVDLDDSKDYRNALAITILYQDNVLNNVSGITCADRSTGHLMFVPSTTSATTQIRIRTLWLK